MKILAPVDKSTRDAVAVAYIERLGAAVPVEAALLCVVPTMRAFLPHATREAEAYVDAVALGLRGKGLQAESFIVKGGEVAEAIVHTADQIEADLILMVTRGRQGFNKLVLGSVAATVLGISPRPVLLLSESSATLPADQAPNAEATYVGAAVWRMKDYGLVTADEAERLIARLGTLNLDVTEMLASYKSKGEQGHLFERLDHEFQLQTLAKYFPDDVIAWARHELLHLPREKAA